MSPSLIIPDWQPDVRSWLKAHPYLVPLVGGRVFNVLPDNPSQFPCLRLYTSAGIAQVPGMEAPLFDARASVEVVGKGRSSYNATRQAAIAVQSAVFDLIPGRLVAGGETYCAGAYVTACPDMPFENGDPRYVADVVFTVRTAGTADP